MPVVTVQMWEGQSVENKRRMAAGITDVMAPFMNNKPESIHIVFQEVPLESWASVSCCLARLRSSFSRSKLPGMVRWTVGSTDDAVRNARKRWPKFELKPIFTRSVLSRETK